MMATFHNLFKKGLSIFGKFINFISQLDSKIKGVNMIMGKNAPIYGVHINEIIEQFFDKYMTSNNSLPPSHL
jgi:hypothetical protein